jgi:hypothetical protein
VGDCGDVRVTGNTVVGISAEQVDSLAIGIGVWTWTRSATVHDNTVSQGDINELKPHASWSPLILDGAEQLPAALTFLGNTVHGGGVKPAVQVIILGDLILSSNAVLQPPGSDAPAIEARAGTATVQGNQVRAAKGPNLRLLVDDPRKVAVVGNISTGPIMIGAAQLSAPWASLNVVLP